MRVARAVVMGGGARRAAAPRRTAWRRGRSGGLRGRDLRSVRGRGHGRTGARRCRTASAYARWRASPWVTWMSSRVACDQRPGSINARRISVRDARPGGLRLGDRREIAHAARPASPWMGARAGGQQRTSRRRVAEQPPRELLELPSDLDRRDDRPGGPRASRDAISAMKRGPATPLGLVPRRIMASAEIFVIDRPRDRHLSC